MHKKTFQTKFKYMTMFKEENLESRLTMDTKTPMNILTLLSGGMKVMWFWCLSKMLKWMARHYSQQLTIEFLAVFNKKMSLC